MTGKVMTARKKALQPLTPSPQEQSAVLIMNRQPRSILEKYSRDQVRQLYEFLHNDNPPYRILTGDGDYIPLIEEAMRTGMRLFVGAFSEGLNERLRVAPDEFFDLDEMFFGD